jgi:hypothetical protein
MKKSEMKSNHLAFFTGKARVATTPLVSGKGGVFVQSSHISP